MLSTLLTPFLLATSLVIGVGVLEHKAVVLKDIMVPRSVSEAGYPPAVVSARISDVIASIEREARTRPEGRRLALQADEGPFDLIADYFHLTPIVQAMQDMAGMLDWSVGGEIVERGDRLEFRARLRRKNGVTQTITIDRPRTEIEALLADAAERILRAVDPHVVCGAFLSREILEGTTDGFGRTRECISAEMHTAERADLVWLINLEGIVRSLTGDARGAMHAFARTVRLDNDFSPGLLNLGVLFADAGRHEEAIKAFRQVFTRVAHGDSPQTYAATLVEWGDSLLALGRREEALRKYEEAVLRDPLYADAFFRWAEVLGPGPRADELRMLGQLARGEREPVFVENLIGLVREARSTGNAPR